MGSFLVLLPIVLNILNINKMSNEAQTSTSWKLIGHSYAIADTGDYDGHYEITNGTISLLTKDDDEESLQPIVDALNDSGCEFYQTDYFKFENNMLREEISRLKSMLGNGLTGEDIE